TLIIGLFVLLLCASVSLWLVPYESACMIRRRRRSVRETPFSLDSFLDLVTNIVGIIIRLILVAWVGARAYTPLPELLKQVKPMAGDSAEVAAAIEDPLQQELARQKQELAEAEARVLEQLRQLDLLQLSQRHTEEELAALTSCRQELERSRSNLEQAKTGKSQ